MPSSNGSKKSELYEHLFRSIKAGLGIEMDPDIPVEEQLVEYIEKHKMITLVVMYCIGRDLGHAPDTFFSDAPPPLRKRLQEFFEEAYMRNHKELGREGKI